MGKIFNAIKVAENKKPDKKIIKNPVQKAPSISSAENEKKTLLKENALNQDFDSLSNNTNTQPPKNFKYSEINKKVYKETSKKKNIENKTQNSTPQDFIIGKTNDSEIISNKRLANESDTLLTNIASSIEMALVNKIKNQGTYLKNQNIHTANDNKQEEMDETPLPMPVPAKQKPMDNITNNQLLVTRNVNSDFLEGFKLIRTKLLKVMREKGLRTVMVTSAIEGEGKTFISSNLAVSIAMGFDEYVLIVDTDFHKSQLNRQFNIDEMEGLSNFLCGEQADLGKLFYQTGIPKLSALFAGTRLENAVYMLSSELMKNLVAHMRSRYADRYIIFDAPPIQLSETIALSSVVDGVILVIDAGKTGKRTITKALELFDKDKILGVVLNRYSRAKNEVYTYQYY